MIRVVVLYVCKTETTHAMWHNILIKNIKQHIRLQLRYVYYIPFNSINLVQLSIIIKFKFNNTELNVMIFIKLNLI